MTHLDILPRQSLVRRAYDLNLPELRRLHVLPGAALMPEGPGSKAREGRDALAISGRAAVNNGSHASRVAEE
jgi:hypothetical protein